MKKSGTNLERGVEVPSLKRDLVWEFNATAKVGDKVTGGDVIGTVQETPIVLHKIMIPVKVQGTIKSIKSGSYKVTDTVAVVTAPSGEEVEITLMQNGRYVLADLTSKSFHPMFLL